MVENIRKQWREVEMCFHSGHISEVSQKRLSALLRGVDAPNLFLMEADHNWVDLHRTDSAGQEVIVALCIQLIFF